MKVYLSHTDMARIQEAAQTVGMSTSAFVRMVALAAADSLGICKYGSLMDVLKGQEELPLGKAGGE